MSLIPFISFKNEDDLLIIAIIILLLKEKNSDFLIYLVLGFILFEH